MTLANQTSAVSFSENDFWLSYDTGYRLFLSTTILMSILFAIVWGYYARRHDTWASRRQGNQWSRYLANFLLLLILEASVVVLTWAGSLYSSTHHRGQTSGPYLGLAGLLLGTICSLILLAFLTDFLYLRVGRRDKESMYVLFALFINTILALLPGFAMLTVYCKQMMDMKLFTYYGPMILTDVSVENWKMGNRFSKLREGSDTMEKNGPFMYIGKPRVHWGWEWGCPETPMTWCSTSVYEPDCVHCEGQIGFEQGNVCKMEGNATNAEKCVKTKYRLVGLGIDNNSDTLEPVLSGHHRDDFFKDPLAAAREQALSSPPEQLYFYGDCRNCNAMVPSSYNYLIRHNQSLHDTGIGLELLAISIYAVLVLWVIVQNHLGKSRDEEEQSSESAGDEVPSEEDSIVDQDDNDNEGAND